MLDTSAYRQSYLFFLENEKKLCRMLGHEDTKLFYPRAVCKIQTVYFDTDDHALEKENIEFARVMMHIGYNENLNGIGLGGLDKSQYSTDNIWKTQSQRLITTDITVEKISYSQDKLQENLKVQGTPFTMNAYESPFNCKKTDIGIAGYELPEAKISYIRFFSPLCGSCKNSQHVLDIDAGKNYKAFKDAEHRYERSNYLKVMRFIEEAFTAGAIKPVTEMPGVMMRKALPRFE